jgi:hypothetical protein
VSWINITRSIAYCLDSFKTIALPLYVFGSCFMRRKKSVYYQQNVFFFFFFCTMTKEAGAPTLPLLASSPIRQTLQHLVQNHTLWTAPIIILLFALFVRWSVALNPYSGRFIIFITRLFNISKKRIQHTTNIWWLRSSETLDGDYFAFTFFKMVYLWFAVVGTWLSPFNSLSQLVMWIDVTNKRNQKEKKNWCNS